MAGDRDLQQAALQGGHPVAWFDTLAELLTLAKHAGIDAGRLNVHGTLIPQRPPHTTEITDA